MVKLSVYISNLDNNTWLSLIESIVQSLMPTLHRIRKAITWKLKTSSFNSRHKYAAITIREPHTA